MSREGSLNDPERQTGDALDRAFALREAGNVIMWHDFCSLWLRWRRLSQWKI